MNGGGSGTGDAVGSDLAFLHCLKQRRLRLGRGPIDLVGEDDLRVDRSLAPLEVLGFLVIDGNAGHVRGQQVGGELDAIEGAPGRHGKCPRQHRLAGAGHILDQQVTIGDQSDDCLAYFSRLAEDDALDIGHDAEEHGSGIIHQGVLRLQVCRSIVLKATMPPSVRAASNIWFRGHLMRA